MAHAVNCKSNIAEFLYQKNNCLFSNIKSDRNNIPFSPPCPSQLCKKSPSGSIPPAFSPNFSKLFKYFPVSKASGLLDAD